MLGEILYFLLSNFSTYSMIHSLSSHENAFRKHSPNPTTNLEFRCLRISFLQISFLTNFVSYEFRFNKFSLISNQANKGTSNNDVQGFFAIFDLPTYLVLLYNVRFWGPILDPPIYPNIGFHYWTFPKEKGNGLILNG